MKNFIKKCRIFLKDRPRLRQWLWFIFLWVSGVVVAMSLAYPIKFLVKML